MLINLVGYWHQSGEVTDQHDAQYYPWYESTDPVYLQIRPPHKMLLWFAYAKQCHIIVVLQLPIPRDCSLRKEATATLLLPFTGASDRRLVVLWTELKTVMMNLNLEWWELLYQEGEALGDFTTVPEALHASLLIILFTDDCRTTWLVDIQQLTSCLVHLCRICRQGQDVHTSSKGSSLGRDWDINYIGPQPEVLNYVAVVGHWMYLQHALVPDLRYQKSIQALDQVVSWRLVN